MTDDRFWGKGAQLSFDRRQFDAQHTDVVLVDDSFDNDDADSGQGSDDGCETGDRYDQKLT